MSCASGTMRYILFFFNFLLALAGLGILVLGIATARSDGASFNDIVHGQLTTPAIMFSIVGACVFIFAFFGCCGALRESHCMICTYAVLLLTLFLLQVAVAVLAYTYKGQTKDLVTESIKERFENYKADNSTRISIDAIQQKFECCGSVNIHTPWDLLAIPPPQSCFPHNERTKPMFNTACVSKLVDTVEDSLSIIAKVAIIVGIIQIVGIVFALCVANSIKRSELRNYT